MDPMDVFWFRPYEAEALISCAQSGGFGATADEDAVDSSERVKPSPLLPNLEQIISENPIL